MLLSSKCYMPYYQQYKLCNSNFTYSDTSQIFYRMTYKLKISIKHFNQFSQKNINIKNTHLIIKCQAITAQCWLRSISWRKGESWIIPSLKWLNCRNFTIMLHKMNREENSNNFMMLELTGYWNQMDVIVQHSRPASFVGNK